MRFINYKYNFIKLELNQIVETMIIEAFIKNSVALVIFICKFRLMNILNGMN